MNASRLVYRTWQFWQALGARPAPADLEQARRFLSPPLFSLFLQMQPSEQAHSLRVFQMLAQQGATQPDLLVAALLHDVGKSRFPLRLWERALIVLARLILPAQAKAWGGSRPDQPATGARRAFVIAAWHAAWGASMAAQAGASPTAVTLIARHQDRLERDDMIDARLAEHLRRLQSVDDES